MKLFTTGDRKIDTTMAWFLNQFDNAHVSGQNLTSILPWFG